MYVCTYVAMYTKFLYIFRTADWGQSKLLKAALYWMLSCVPLLFTISIIVVFLYIRKYVRTKVLNCTYRTTTMATIIFYMQTYAYVFIFWSLCVCVEIQTSTDVNVKQASIAKAYKGCPEYRIKHTVVI